MRRLLLLPCFVVSCFASLRAAEPTPPFVDATPVGAAINQLGLDLLRSLPAGVAQGNALLSPYSIESALALAYAGAEGRTREDMRRVLHLPGADAEALANFARLDGELRGLARASVTHAAQARQHGDSVEPITLLVANRVYAQEGLPVLPEYLATIRDTLSSDLATLDFRGAIDSARGSMNFWVASETNNKIRDLIPPNGIDRSTRAVLVNALFLRAPWEKPFPPRNTKPEPFFARGDEAQPVPTMVQTTTFGFRQHPGFSVIALPYAAGALQFVVLVPEDAHGLSQLVGPKLADTLTECAHLPKQKIELHLPKFRIAGPTLSLGNALAELGMASAFDRPPGSANFNRMVRCTPADYLTFSEVFHKTFLELDEKGTEAAAATALAMRFGASMNKPEMPPVIRVDRPFLFAVQHVDSGACLFLGWVNDPR